MQWKKTLSKPVAGGGTLATFFNERLQTDIFLLWGRWYIIWVDEATRYAISQFMQSRDAKEYFRVFLTYWIRYFGAPITLVSDQEGAVMSDMMGRVCETFSVQRDLAGSGGHTRTGIAERRLGIVKLGALKFSHSPRNRA